MDKMDKQEALEDNSADIVNVNGWIANDDNGRPGLTPLVQRVYQGLLVQISAGDYEPEQRLPGEHELAEQFLVSRPVVRDALSRLRNEGLIYSRRGAGSFVKARPEESRALVGYAPVETIADIQRCYEFRLSIEPDHAHYAALRWNKSAFDAIASALDLMQAATRAHRHREDADFAFHCAIAEAANNHYYLSSLQALKDHIAVGMKFHGTSLLGPQGGLGGVLDEHQAIFEAIRNRDADKARMAMRRHLERSRDRVFEGKMLDLAL
jgi:GntR family transcriptional regulator, transcriptional repressor for pyruvate dehydrogenase complex